jgi:hypothetical protein
MRSASLRLSGVVGGRSLLLSAALCAGCAGPDAPILKDAPKPDVPGPKTAAPSKVGNAIKKGQPPFGSSAVGSSNTPK